ncbi:MAG TPA: SprT family zinc-dependent metalloprotease [Rickettsiales bacterium]|nr:SprT family zinc-dependent metalloprotease [Rickettsiales bacterium]
MENADSITIDGRTIPIAIKRSGRARRISLRISPARDGIIITLPRRASIAAGLKFFHSKADWVLANITAQSRVMLAEGNIIPIMGKDYAIKCLPGRGTARLVEQEDGINILEIHCAPEFLARRTKDFLKKLMHSHCLIRCQEQAKILGKTVTRLTLTQAQSRWGSCNGKGAITLNWLLVFAPPNVLEYLIAHEVAHLGEMNHSPRFWKLVEQLMPDMKAARKWLKEHGHMLHRYG